MGLTAHLKILDKYEVFHCDTFDAVDDYGKYVVTCLFGACVSLLCLQLWVCC